MAARVGGVGLAVPECSVHGPGRSTNRGRWGASGTVTHQRPAGAAVRKHKGWGMNDTKWVRLTALAGVLFFVLIIVQGPVLQSTSPNVTDSAQKIFNYIRDHGKNLQASRGDRFLRDVRGAGLGGRSVRGAAQG